MQIILQELIKLNNPKIIDIRTHEEFLSGTIPTSINIPSIRLKTNPEKYLNKTDTYYIFCNKGNTSKLISNILNIQGYKTVNIVGGYYNYLLRK